MSTNIERCHYITRVKSKQNSIQNLFETVKSIESRVQNGLYEFPWLFKVRSSVIYMEDSDPEERLRDAFCSMIREQDKMVPNHFIENYHSCVINDKLIGDPYHPDLAEFKYFKEKPLNFLVIGKPGLNTETVAYRLADIWKSILISPAIAVQTVLPYILDNKSKTKSKEGKHQLTLEQILEAVNFMQTSAESKRQGYVLTGFPLTSFSTNTFDIEKQLEFIFKNITRPNIIIYLTCPSNDVIRLNKNGYFRNIHNNNLYYKQHIEDGEAVYLKNLDTRSVVEFENNRYLLKEYHNFKEEEKTKFFVLESNKNLNNAILDNYVGKIFPILDRYLLQYDSQCVFKVDGRHTTVEIIETIQDKLNILCLIPLCDPSPVFGVALDDGVATKPDSLSFNSILSFEEIKFDVLRKTIESPDESGEETSKDDDESVEDLENKKSSTNEIDLLVLDRYKNLGKQEAFELLKKHCSSNKRFNLLVSDYNNLCPVEMHRGYICEGEIKYTCKYAGKLFLLSSLDAVRKFLKDPARYALSPPLSTRKIAVIGPPMTGKSTVAYYLSGFFGIKVISMRRLIEKVYGLTMRKMEGNMFEVFVEKVRRLQRREGKKHRESEELRASKITNWIKEQIPIIIERLKYSSFTSNQITPTTNEENMAEILKQPLILPNLSFDEFIDTLKKEIKSMTSFEVNFGGKFSQLYKNPQPDFKETYSLTEADSSMMRLRDDFSSRGFDFFDDVIKCKEFLTDPLKLAVYLPPSLRLPEQVREMSYEDVLKSVIDYNGIHTPFGFLRMNVKRLADALEDEILDIEAENNLDYKLESDLKMGGWILDSLPIDEGLWSEIMSRFLLPDDLICKIVDVNCLDAVKDYFLKVEPFTKLKDYYEELVKSSRSIRNFEVDDICSKNKSFDEQFTKTKNVSSDNYETSENEKLGKFLFPDSSVTSFTTKSTRCNNPFNNEDHEISYLRANFWCDRSFLTDYFEQSVTKYLQTAKAEKVSVLGNLHRIQNKDSIESLRLSFAEPIQHSKTTLSSPLDSSLIIEDLSNIDNSQNSIISNSNHKNNLHSQIGSNKHHNRISTGSEGLRNIQGDISKLHETQLENIKSEDYIHWFNERELSLTNEMIWTLEEQHCSKSNSNLSSSILSQVQQNESGERSPEKEASMKSIYSNSCLQFIREGNNYIFNDMSMSLFALHSLVMSELNIFKNKLDTWLVEPFDVTSEFLTKFKTLYPEQFINETNVPLIQCRSKSELQFYQRIVTEKLNLINAIEALMKQDDQFDQVVDYLSKYTQHNGDNLSTEKCFSTTRCSMIPKRQKGTTSLPNVRDSKHQDRFLDGSRLSDSISYNELSVSSDSLTVFEWYVVSDDVLLFSRQSSDFKMIDTEKPSAIYVKRTSKDMELPNMPLKQTASQSLKKDLSSSKSFSMQDARWERPCIWRDCVETKVCHKQTKQRESVNTICQNVVKEIVSSVSSRKRDGEGESISSKNYSKYDKTGEKTSYQTRNLSENSDEATTTKKAAKTFDHLGPEQDSKFDEIVKEKTSPQPSSPIEISNDKKLTSEEAVKTLESADYLKVGKDIESCSRTLTLSDKSKAISNLIQSESCSENSKNSSTKTVSINGDSQSECLYSKAACSKYKCSNTERPYMKLTPFENSKTECLLPHVSADNWLKFLNFISDVYSNIGQFEGRSFEDSVEEICDKVSQSDMYCGVGMKDDENLDGVSLQGSDCVENKMCHKQTGKCESVNTICKNLAKEIVSSILSRERDGKGESISSKNYLKKTGEKTFYQTWQGYNSGGKKIILKEDRCSGDYEGSNVGESFTNDLTILSKLKINLPIPQDQFDTCLDIALRCLTQGKTIEELYSCDPLMCSATTHFTAASLEKLFGQDSLFKQLHICHSHGNESVKYRELPDVYSDTKSNTSETVEVLLKPSLIYSVDGVGLKVSAENIYENSFALNSSQYDTDFLKTVPRAILHLIGMETDKEFCEKTVESEDVVKYCYLIKNYKHLKKFDNNREFYTKLKQLKRLQNESSKVTIESYISAQATTLHRSQIDYGTEPDESCLKTEICSFLSEQSYPILGGSLSELEAISEIDLEDLISSTDIPSKLALFSNSITSSIQAWLKDWSSFKTDFLAIFLNRCKVIEQLFIPEFKDFPDSLVCKLLLSYGSKTVKIDQAYNEKLIKILSRDQSEHTMNDFIENIQPGSDEMDNLREKSNYVNMENLSRSDIFPYCPVTYKEEGKLFIASGQFAATFKDEVYNFATKADQEKFFDNPENYAVQPTSDYRVPPLRICVLSNLFFDDEKRLTRQVADYFNLQSVSLNREIKKLLMQNDSKQLGLINEDTTNMEMFDLGETMFDQDDTYVRKINYIRDYLNLKSTLTESDMKILVDELFCSSTGKVIYGFPHIVEDLSFIVNEKITPNVVVYIDVGDEKKRKIESLQRKVRDQRLLNYGSRLRKLMKLDRLKYVLWNRSRSKLFNIVLRQLLKERRDDKLPTKRLNQLFSRKETTENLDTSGENDDGNDVATRSKNNDLMEENNSTAEKVDSEEGILLKKSPKAGNILYSRKIDAKNRDEFRAYLLEKRKERADEIEIFRCESQTGVLKSNKSFQCFKHLRSSRLAEKNQLNHVSSFESQEANDSKDEESLEERELDERKQVALMDLRHASKKEDRFLPKFESVHYLPADYDAKKEYYLESSSKASSERMGVDPTDSICSREITSSINLHPNLPSSKKSRKIALQYGVHKISEEFLINAYNIFRTKYPPPKSSARNLKPINFNENTESLNTYCSYETENIKAMKELCSKFNIPIIKHSTTNSINKLLESIKSITRWPDVFEKCHIITHKTASELLNNGHYFFSKFGRWCPVAIFEKRLPILQNYPEERLEKLVHPVIHKKYIYFIHTRTSLEKFVSSPLKYIEQDPYLTVFPVKIAVVGCPKSGKTKIIDYLRNLYGLQVIRIDTAVQYVCSQLHWTELAQKIHSCLKQGNLLSSQLTVQALEAYLLSPKYVNHGWILDGFPNSKDDVQAMKKCDIIPQVTICVETNAFWENSLSNKLHEERIYLENLNDGLMLSCGRLKNDVLGKHQEDDNETLFHKYLLPKNFFKYRILKWRQNKAMHEELKTAMNDDWGNILEISWKTNHLKMVARMLEYVKTCLLAFQNYATNMQQNLPASMFCLNLSRTEFEMHLSVFKEVCPCCWYFSKIYHRCPTKNFRDMTTGLYQYGNHIYWICTEHTDIFLHNPTVFINHNVGIFKATYPERLSLVGEKTIEQYFDLQFHGKCVTCYVKNLPNIVLRKGLKTYALALEKKYIYLFCQESCLLSMLIKPQDFSTIKFPRKLKTPNLSPKVSSSTVSTTKHTTKLSPKVSSSIVSKTKHTPNLSPKVSSSTVSTTKPIIVPDYFDNCNIYDVLCNALLRVAKVRPRIFEIDNEISSCIYLALILKAQANKSIIVILNNILACFESYSNMIHVTCSFIDSLACALNVSNLDENDGTEVHTQYFFDRLIPLLASSRDDKYIRDV